MFVIRENELCDIIRDCIMEEVGINNQYIIDMLSMGYIAHGDVKSDISGFDEQHINGGFRGVYGYGFYFTDKLYKCIEYGDSIYFTPMSIYSFLSLDDGGIFKDMIGEYDSLRFSISKYEMMLSDADNTQSYNYYSNKIEILRGEYDRLYSDYDFILHYIKNGVSKYKDDDEHVYRYVISNLPSNMVKDVSSFLLRLGYDGVKCGNQYCIFNFDKLNGNITK